MTTYVVAVDSLLPTLHTMSKLQFPSDDELDLVVIAIQALLPHEPDPKFHDFHAIDRGREILRDCLNRWMAPMNLEKAKQINEMIEESVYGPGEETPPCANAWEVSKLVASLEDRLQRLEAADVERQKAYPIIGDVSWSESIIVPTTTIHPTVFDADS
jgi:hypothetical protein